MIRIEQISASEAQRLKEEGITSYWALPLGMTFIFLILNWLFSAEWSMFFYQSGGIWLIFICVWLLCYKTPKFTTKIIRRGKIIHAAYLGNNPMAKLNIGQHIDITLEEESIPEPYLARHSFTVWENTGTVFFKQDDRLRYRYKELGGKKWNWNTSPKAGR